MKGALSRCFHRFSCRFSLNHPLRRRFLHFPSSSIFLHFKSRKTERFLFHFFIFVLFLSGFTFLHFIYSNNRLNIVQFQSFFESAPAPVLKETHADSGKNNHYSFKKWGWLTARSNLRWFKSWLLFKFLINLKPCHNSFIFLCCLRFILPAST